MDYRNKIFEMLGVEPEEEFLLNDSTYPHKFNKELNVLYKDDDGEWRYAETEYLHLILRGMLNIKKIIKPTPEDEIVFAYGRLCGYNWVAVDEDKAARFTMYKPCRSKKGNFWDAGTEYKYIGTKISCLSWKDEPYYIGE